MEIFKWFEGKKTLLACALGLALIGAVGMGWIQIPKEQFNQIVEGMTLVAIAMLRMAK